MENKLKLWIARDEDGLLYVHFDHQLIKGNRQWRRLHSEADSGVDIIKLYSDLFPSVRCEDEEPTEAYITLAESQEQTKQEQKIDWEQRRYEIAKEMLPVLYQQSAEILKCGQSVTWKDAVGGALNFADMLIAKLKEQMTEYELDKLCKRNPVCDCKCIKCPLFAKYVESNNK